VSGLNCKPGQMAMVVRGEPAVNLGRVVRVLELSRGPTELLLGLNLWLYEGYLSMGAGIRADAVSDLCLRPLRDDFEPESIDTDIPVKQGETA
jgi:hypothetical protein